MLHPSGCRVHSCQLAKHPDYAQNPLNERNGLFTSCGIACTQLECNMVAVKPAFLLPPFLATGLEVNLCRANEVWGNAA
jgi:hypothetical protein